MIYLNYKIKGELFMNETIEPMKVLLSRNHMNGLFVIEGNDRPFVVATINEYNGIGKKVNSWSSGVYFSRLEDAIRYLNSR